MGRPSRREQLLDAAVAVIRRDGAAALTLDAVAAEAGVSKGGVLYHFASKRALIDGLLERWLDEFGARLVSAFGDGANQGGRLQRCAAVGQRPENQQALAGLEIERHAHSKLAVHTQHVVEFVGHPKDSQDT